MVSLSVLISGLVANIAITWIAHFTAAHCASSWFYGG